MRISATRLRQDVYNIIDEVLATGVAIEVERNGRVVRIEPAEDTSWLDELPLRPDVIAGNPDDLVHVDWTHEWHPAL